ncbi:MAG: hypothetical protein GEV07_29430 [Streptosporangiales bacterium]|nr:hypothetical protein [Streptosporangiales bacterium]
MLIVGLILGAFLGALLSAVLWATGRRPYLRVDVQQHTTREVVHHVVVPEPASGPHAVEAAVVAEAVSAMPTVRPHPAVYREALTPLARKEIGR